jgi:GNAT superfamily N-acetyltransferase
VIHGSAPVVAGGGVTIREMALPDLGAALRLSRANSWNQTQADWRFLLDENPGRFVAAVQGAVIVGTGGAVCYGKRLAWVCMILVDSEARGRGTGSAIVSAVLDRVADMETIGLDATPFGRGVYERLGFAPASSLVRVGGVANVAAGTLGVGGTRPVEAHDIEDILWLDREAFGADRSHAIAWVWTKAPLLAWCATDDGRVAGYCFGREGDRAAHIGPLVARNAETARALVASAAGSVPGRALMLDASTRDSAWLEALRDLGLREQRPFTRMYRAGAAPPGRPELTFAAFGPELG